MRRVQNEWAKLAEFRPNLLQVPTRDQRWYVMRVIAPE